MSGTVYLVGAGPGDPGLLTVRAVELIGAADVVLYDRLIPPEALAYARAGAEVLYVGKEGEGPQVPQDETHALLLEHARAGRTVVRLKGGDPFVFGRGGEEALVLAEAGIPFEVVPGVTAGVAAPAYAGIPVTHRDSASGVAFVTGHERPDRPDSAIDWAGLARFPGTLVFYMGVRTLPRIAERLIAEGRPPDEPVSARCSRASTTSPSARPRSRSARRRSRSSAPSPASARTSPGSSGGRCTGAPSRSRARGRRRARWRRGCARSARRSSRRRRSGSGPSTRRCRRPPTTTWCA
jgi:uroporphyrin-III C-methyltransferase